MSDPVETADQHNARHGLAAPPTVSCPVCRELPLPTSLKITGPVSFQVQGRALAMLKDVLAGVSDTKAHRYYGTLLVGYHQPDVIARARALVQELEKR
jgi:hypothetical protein